MLRVRRDDGHITAFVTVFALAIVSFAGLVLDGGLALAAKTRALGEAQEAARAGAQSIDLAAYRRNGTVRLLPKQAQSRARQYLDATEDSGQVSVAGNTVAVSVTARQDTQLLGLLGLHTLTVTSTGRAHPVHGIEAPEQ